MNPLALTSESREKLARWVESLLSTPGLTSAASPEDAWRIHVEDALVAASLVDRGPVVDVGSGGGSPGIPLAAAHPELRFDLLEASEKRCAFLRAAAREFPNVSVVRARAEEHGAAAGRDAYGTALARALAPPPVAAEWCLPLVAPGGRVVLFTGELDLARLAAVADRLGGARPEIIPVEGFEQRNLVVIEKTKPTPSGFPRRAGVARKRPLP